MKRIYFTAVMLLLTGSFFLHAEDIEQYLASYVSESNLPEIDGEIDAIWDQVTMVDIAKVPENGNITEPNPNPDDFSASFGMMWNDYGLFVIFQVTDDNIVIEDDYYLDNDIEADMWWTDDNINLLFSQDLINESFSQWEFAWQEGVDQEEKLTSSDWANDAKIDISTVESAWYNEGDLWILETFISWEAFGYEAGDLGSGDVIYCEARVRDDDDGDSWESMFQWSTSNYDVESTGEGMGAVTLTSDEITSTSDIAATASSVQIMPNVSNGDVTCKISSATTADVSYEIVSLTGKTVKSGVVTTNQVTPLSLSELSAGIYFIKAEIDNAITTSKFIIK